MEIGKSVTDDDYCERLLQVGGVDPFGQRRSEGRSRICNVTMAFQALEEHLRWAGTGGRSRDRLGEALSEFVPNYYSSFLNPLNLGT